MWGWWYQGYHLEWASGFCFYSLTEELQHDVSATVDLDDWTDNDIVIQTDSNNQGKILHDMSSKPLCSQHSAAEDICHVPFIPQPRSCIESISGFSTHYIPYRAHPQHVLDSYKSTILCQISPTLSARRWHFTRQREGDPLPNSCLHGRPLRQLRGERLRSLLRPWIG